MSNERTSPSEISFSDFAELMQPSGAVNRFPAIGKGPDVYSYTVYMNGPMNSGIPGHSLEHTFKDVMLHALTDKLGLNSASARDNLKVAEVVALRGAWMSSVLERSSGAALSDEVVKDYELLSDGLTHPWIVGELDAQRALMSKLEPALLQANIEKDIVPREMSIGKILAQDENFTFQKTNDGEVVTHENRRLEETPAVGTEVTVSYYRGHGQVVNSLENLKVSPPFLDPIDGDLAVMLEDGKGFEQVILFNSLTAFEKFISSHGLDRDMVRQAIDVREASPKIAPPVPVREVINAPYVDALSGSLAVDYKENSTVSTALFRDANELAMLAGTFGLGKEAVATAKKLEEAGLSNVPNNSISKLKTQASVESLQDKLQSRGFDNFLPAGIEGKSYIGKVVEVSLLHIAQDTGRGAIVIHDKRALDKLPLKGDMMTVKIQDGRGKVEDMAKDSQSVGR